MSQRRLYLLGGSAAFDVVAEEFVPAAGGREATIALLLQGGSDWEKYVPDYTEPWTRRGVAHHHVIVPDENRAWDIDQVAARLGEATGIFIGGGHTPTYRQLYATEPLRSVIRERYRAGIPVAGVSARAFIALEDCVLDADEVGEDSLRIEAGLGLASNLVIEVHFTEQDRLSNLLAAMVRLQAHTGWGIDEPACMVLEDGELTRVLGRSVYKVEMTDLMARTYTMTEWNRI
jgi:cyanophycinase